jgi:ribosomal protein L37AE/L43A
MSADSTQAQGLECPKCGSPVRTTERAGTIVKCDCCGAAVEIPDDQYTRIDERTKDL